MPEARHPKKEVHEAVDELRKADWEVELRTGHAWAVAKCPYGCCMVSIWSTPQVPGNHARQLRRSLERCPGEEAESDA